MSRYIHSQQATNKAFENLDFSDVGTMQEIISLLQTDNFKQHFTTPQNFGSGEFFNYMKKYKYYEN